MEPDFIIDPFPQAEITDRAFAHPKLLRDFRIAPAAVPQTDDPVFLFGGHPDSLPSLVLTLLRSDGRAFLQ